jgi:hypothetical protein
MSTVSCHFLSGSTVYICQFWGLPSLDPHGLLDNPVPFPTVQRYDFTPQLSGQWPPSEQYLITGHLELASRRAGTLALQEGYDRDEGYIDAVIGLIDQLPSRQAEALQLHLSGLTYKQIGKKMDMTEAGAKKAQTRAINTLRELYDERN